MQEHSVDVLKILIFFPQCNLQLYLVMANVPVKFLFEVSLVSGDDGAMKAIVVSY